MLEHLLNDASVSLIIALQYHEILHSCWVFYRSTALALSFWSVFSLRKKTGTGMAVLINLIKCEPTYPTSSLHA